MNEATPDPLQVLIGRMTRGGLDIGVDNLLGAFWLALQPGLRLDFLTAGPPPAPMTTRLSLELNPGEQSPPANKQSDEVEEKRSPDKVRSEDPARSSTDVFSRPADDNEETQPASPLRIPAGSALASKLPLARSLRPLRKWFRNQQITQLDEQETVEETARAGGILIPILEPARERWYELMLVSDSGSTMDVWLETMNEFESVARTAGVFRDVRRFRLTWNPETQATGETAVEERAMLVNADGLASQAVTLAQTNTRRLIFVATNGVGVSWTDGSMAALLRTWSEYCSVAILQMLPEDMWPRVRTGEPSLLLRLMEPGLVTDSLEAGPLWWDEALHDAEGNITKRVEGAIPILPLDPSWLKKWAGMQMGSGQWVPGIVVAQRVSTQVAPAPAERTRDDWSKLVASFMRKATPEAHELAVYLSRGTFTLPVARLVQAAMLGERASQTQLAEILMSGLTERTTAADAQVAAEWVEYRFHPEPSTILMRGLRESDEEAMADTLARHIERYWGKPVDFRALVYDAQGLSSISKWAQPFAKLGSLLLNLPAEPEPADDGRPTLFILPILPEYRGLALQIAAQLDAKQVRVLVSGRHRVPAKGIALVIMERRPDTPPTVLEEDVARTVENGLEVLELIGAGTKPAPSPSPSGVLYYDSYSTPDALCQAILGSMTSLSQAPAPSVMGAPPLDRERGIRPEVNDLELAITLSVSAKVYYSNEVFDARAVIRDLVWIRDTRLSFTAGVQWLRRGETVPSSPGWLLVFENWDQPVPQPTGCSCILLDPEFAAVADIRYVPVYEGSNERTHDQINKLLAARRDDLIAREVIDPGSLGGFNSLHLLSVLDRLSRSQVWPSVRSRIEEGFRSSSEIAPAIEIERSLRVIVFDELDPALRSVAGIFAALFDDEPAEIVMDITTVADCAPLLELELLTMRDSVLRATSTGRYLARHHADWPRWNRNLLELLEVPDQWNWDEAAGKYDYVRRNLVRHIREAYLSYGVTNLMSDFRWWALRIEKNEARELVEELQTESHQRTSSWVAPLIDSIPGFQTLGAMEIAKRLMEYTGKLPENLRESATRFVMGYERLTPAPVQVAGFAITSAAEVRRPATLPKVLVVGTGREVISPQETLACQELGRRMAQLGLNLIGGGWPGVDYVVAQEFVNQWRQENTSVEPALTQILAPGQTPVFPEGEKQYVGSAGQEGFVAVQACDAVILIGGLAGTYDAYKWATEMDKPVFPIAGTGGDARRAFDDMVKKGLLPADDKLGSAISFLDDAREVVDLALHRLMGAPPPQVA